MSAAQISRYDTRNRRPEPARLGSPFRAGRGWFNTVLVVLLTSSVPLAAQTSRPGVQAFDEATLWERVQRALTRPPQSDSFAENYDRRMEAVRRRVEATETYLRLYPGGEHRDEAVSVELAALFEQGAMEGGAFAPLCQRVQSYLRNPWSPTVEEEAAYWDLTCRILKRSEPSASRPTSTYVEDDSGLIELYRDYVERYPRSRHAPQLFERVFRAADRRHDMGTMRRVAQQMQTQFPAHAITEWIIGRLHLLDQVGKPFAWKFTATNGAPVDLATWVGRPVLIVVWTAAERTSRDLAVKVEQFRREHWLHVVGVCTDEWRERLDTVSQSLGLDWPQYFDGRGPACDFARQWGIDTFPRVLVLDAAGRLLGDADAADWEGLVRHAAGLPTSRPTTTAP